MELRSGSVPEPEASRPGGSAGSPNRWRVTPGLVVAKAIGAVALGLVALFAWFLDADRLQIAVAGLAAVGVAAFALRDLIAPVRVEADAGGIGVVTGFARRVRLPWPRIEAVRVDTRSRYGLRSEHLEIDAGESLYLFSANDLGAPPAEVAAALEVLRSLHVQGRGTQ